GQPSVRATRERVHRIGGDDRRVRGAGRGGGGAPPHNPPPGVQPRGGAPERDAAGGGPGPPPTPPGGPAAEQRPPPPSPPPPGGRTKFRRCRWGRRRFSFRGACPESRAGSLPPVSPGYRAGSTSPRPGAADPAGPFGASRGAGRGSPTLPQSLTARPTPRPRC